MSAARSLLALLLAASPAFADVDLLLVEHPEGLRILDRYQQSVQHPSRVGIVPLVPMRIIEARGLLSDGFTPAMRVEIDGETFFLLTDDAGHLLQPGRPGTVRRERAAVIVNDTVELLRGGASTLRDPLTGSRTPLVAGTRMRREFRSGSDTYVRVLGNGPTFGWVRLEERDRARLWQRSAGPPPTAAAPLHSTETRVRALLDQTNALLDSLYAFMNARLRTSREPPRWELQRADGGLRCVLHGLAHPAAMTESTAVLAKRIELAVAGAGVRVSHSADTILIQP
jgi:hypothetical protein